MRRQLSRFDIGSLVLIALTTAIGLLLWPRLPAQVAIHFSADGTPGNFVSRTAAVVGMPVVMVATGAVLKAAARFDPPENPPAFDGIVCSTMALLLFVQLYTLGTGLGYQIPIAVVIFTTALWTVFVVGYSIKTEGSRS